MEESPEPIEKKKASGPSRGAVVAVAVFVALAIILLIVAYLITRTEGLPDAVRVMGGESAQTSSSSSVKTTSIKSTSDLDAITVELDGADLAALDSELNQLETDSSAF